MSTESKKYNNLSPKLKSFLPKLKPKERIKFQLNGLRHDPITGKLVCPQSYRIQSTDRIYDPWAIEVKKVGAKIEYEGDYVDLAYILREQPAPVDSPKDNIVEFGTLRFKRAQAGVIEIIGGHREMEKALILLFFSNHNAANVDKEWYVKQGGKPIFHTIVPKEDDKKILNKELKKDQAMAIISEMSEEEINTAAAGLMPNKYRSMTPDGKIIGLRKIGASNPEKIIGLSKNVDVRTTAFIEDCLKAGLINMDRGKGEFVWGDDKSKICSIKAGQTPHNSLKRYFMTEDGVEVLSSLEKQLALTKKPLTEKTEKAVV